MTRLFRIAALLYVLAAQIGAIRAQSRPVALEVAVVDRDGEAIHGVTVQVKTADAVAATGETERRGLVLFPQLPPGRYSVILSKEGLIPVVRDDVVCPAIMEVMMLPLAQHNRVDVVDKADPVEEGAAVPVAVDSRLAKAMPNKPATVTEALPMIPGVVRSPAGDVQMSGGGEHRSALIVNSADVTDPATGQFGLTVPIDSVETLSVFQTPFLAEYGRFTAGVVSVETRRGGEVWKWELNDPFPDFRIYSWKLRGVRDATPRINAEGPLIKRKLYFAEGLEYEFRNTEVRTLPFPRNLTRKAGVNSFAQLDWVQSERNLVTGTVHVAPQRLGFARLDYFNPQPTTPDAATHNYTGTVADRLTLWGGLLENTVSFTQFDARVWGQGDEDLTITPGGRYGNYFSQQDRDARRLSWSPMYSAAPFSLLGSHGFKLGSYVARSDDLGQVVEHPIDIRDGNGRLYERITFWGGRPFEMLDTEYAFFGQDHWSISSRLAADLGVRTESQQISQSLRVAPRAGLAWVPFTSSGTVVRAGFGLFYDRVPLNVYSFNHYPKRILTFYGEDGDVEAGPFFFGNALTQVNIRSPFVFHKQVPGDFSPRSATGSLYLDQIAGPHLRLRVGYMQNQSAGVVTLNSVGPDPQLRIGAYELSGAGSSRYRQLEVTARFRAAGHEIFFSYMRSRARGDLNDFGSYLGSFPLAIIRANFRGTLASDMPNRFLAWGVLPLRHGFRLAPILEYRNGVPYSVTDGRQEYVGVPNSSRFRNFLSLDSRLSKDIRMNAKYTVRLSLVSYNLTNHFNPDTVHSNIADVACGRFFGSRGRRFTADFDVLF